MLNKKIIYNLGILILYLFLFVFLYVLIKGFIGYLFVSGIMAYLIHPFLVWMETKLKFKRIISVVTLFILIFFVFLFVLVPVLLRVFSEVQNLYNTLVKVDYKKMFLNWYEKALILLNRFPLPENIKAYLKKEKIKEFFVKNDYFKKISTSLAKNIKIFAGNMFSFVVKNVSSVFSSIMNFLFIPIFLFYFLLDYEVIREFLVKILPASWNETLKPYVERSISIFSSFFRGQIIIAMFIGVGMSLILFISGIDFAFVIGPLAGFANLVPYLGVIVGLTPTILIIFLKFGFTTVGWIKLGMVLGGFALLQFIDGFFMSPRIIGSAVELHPLAVILGIMMGGELAGFWGMILAIPFLAILKMIYFEILLPQFEKVI
jgi:predicted PurR-regulated permease PerM